MFLRLFPPLIAVVSILTALGDRVAAATHTLGRSGRSTDRGARVLPELAARQHRKRLPGRRRLGHSPLQHLWSMAVQGQFYLLAIALVSVIAYVASRVNPNYFRPSLAVTLLVLTAGSFLYALAKSSRHQAWAYYDSGARLWELASVVCWPF